jgi:long-chain acyl-CoA synthetase
MKAYTILDHLLQRKEEHPQTRALQFKDGAQWLQYSWEEYFRLIETVGAALADVGVQPGDSVAIAAETRLEWSTADFGIMGLGGVTVPIYPNNLEDDVQFILNDSSCKVLIIEDSEQLEKWTKIKARCPSVKSVVLIETNDSPLPTGVVSWTTFLQNGRQKLKAEPNLFVDTAKTRTRQDIATILYTSGTTGRPKGVVLTHEQIMSEIEDIFSLVVVNENDLSLSFLPYSHVLGRVEAWGHVYRGYVLAFAESIDRLKANLKEVRPTFMIAVPRIFEKIYGGILAQVENNQLKRKIFEKALRVGKEVSEAIQAKKPLGVRLTFEYALAKKMVFNNVLKALGGRMRFAVSGGAPLSADIAKFFHGLGLLICEGYGLTETTAAIAFNSPLAYKFGSVGRPLADVKVKFADDGEILVSSKKVMKEYFNNPKATAEVFADGYFKTGDIGHLDSEGFLFITDRKKDLIKTAGGKYVAPQRLENLLKTSPHIANVLIHGDQKKYIVALVTVSPSLQGQYNAPETQKLIQEAVAEANSSLASFESIKKFAILPGEFTVETGELTPSLKVKRKFCDTKFKKQIDELYSF